MPRPPQPRTIYLPDALARRIAHERLRRGWSHDGLAKRCEAVGCPIGKSAIYKIETQGQTVKGAELVAFARVFEVSVEDLLDPPEILAEAEAKALVTEYVRTSDEVTEALRAHFAAQKALHVVIANRPELRGYLRDVVEQMKQTRPDLAVTDLDEGA